MTLDIIIVILLLIGAIIGYKRGLVGIVVSLASIILSIILSIVLQGPISEALYNRTGVGTIIEQTVYNNLNSSNKEAENDNNIYSSIIDSIIDVDNKKMPIEQVSKTVTMFILKGVSFILIFIIVSIICYIVQAALNLVFSIPLLHMVNKLGGVAAGIIKYLLRIYILLAIVLFIAPMDIMEPVIKIINSSMITKLLYNNNILVSLICLGLKI